MKHSRALLAARWNAMRIVTGLPAVSKMQSNPRPSVSAMACSMNPSCEVFTAASAPMRSASSSRPASRSNATSRRAPMMRAHCAVKMPIVPQPSTATSPPPR